MEDPLEPISNAVYLLGNLSALALLVWFIARFRTRRDSTALDIYLHLAAGAALTALAIGASRLAGALLGELPARQELAAGAGAFLRTRLIGEMALVVVATPLWAVHWSVLQRRERRTGGETPSVLKSTYLHVVLAVAAVAGIAALTNLLRAAITLADAMDASTVERLLSALGYFLVAAAVWGFHVRLLPSQPVPTGDPGVPAKARLYLLAGVGLLMAAGGAERALAAPLDFLFAAGTVLSGDRAGNAILREAWAGGVLLAGCAAFLLHWPLVRREGGDRIRLVYLLLVTAAGGAALVGGLSWTFYELLRLGFGHRMPTGQWAFLSDALPTMAIGGIVMSGHAGLLREELARPTEAARRVRSLMDYSLAVLGAVLLTVGVASLLRALIERGVAGPAELGRPLDWWRDQVSAAITLILTGAPTWMISWRRVELAVLQRGAAERGSVLRRIYLYAGLLGLLVAALVAAVGVVRALLALLLGEHAEAKVMAGLFGSAGNLATVSVALAYFTRVIVSDRAAAPAAEAPPAVEGAPTIRALVAPGAGEVLRAVEERLGRPIERMGELEPGPIPAGAIPADRLEALRDLVSGSENQNVLLLVSQQGVGVVRWR